MQIAAQAERLRRRVAEGSARDNRIREIERRYYQNMAKTQKWKDAFNEGYSSYGKTANNFTEEASAVTSGRAQQARTPFTSDEYMGRASTASKGNSGG